MRLRSYILVGTLLVASLLPGCNKGSEEDTGPQSYTATAYLEVLPVAEGGLVAETLESMAMPDRVELEIKLAGNYDLIREMFQAPGQQVTSTDWYTAIEGGDPDEALAAVMELHPVANEATWIGVSVTLDNAEEAALLANAAARAIVTQSDVSVGDLYRARFEEIGEAQQDLSFEYNELDQSSYDLRMDVQNRLEQIEGDLMGATDRLARFEEDLESAMAALDALTTLEGDALLSHPPVAGALENYPGYREMVEMLPAAKTALDIQLAAQGADNEGVQRLQAQYESLLEQVDGIHEAVAGTLRSEAQDRADESEYVVSSQKEFIEGLRAELEDVLGEQEAVADVLAELTDLQGAIDAIDELARELEIVRAIDHRLRLVKEATVPN